MTKEIDSLRLFNEKARKLANSNFAKQIQEYPRVSAIEIVKKGEKSERVYVNITPTTEAIDAFVLTFRFFIQNNERCSFGNLDDVYSRLPVSEEMKKQFRETRRKLNEYLDSRIGFKDIEKSGMKQDLELSRRKLLDVFVYGGLAHASPEKKQLFDEWMGGSAHSLLEHEFNKTLLEVLKIIKFVKNLNVKTIKAVG